MIVSLTGRGVRGNVNVVLMCFSLMTQGGEHFFFKYLLSICISSFEMSVQLICLFIIWIFYLVLAFLSSLHILNINALLEQWLAKRFFFPSCCRFSIPLCWLFSLLWKSVLFSCNLICQFLLLFFLCFWSLIQEIVAFACIVECFLYAFLQQTSNVSSLTLKFFIQFELTFVLDAT